MRKYLLFLILIILLSLVFIYQGTYLPKNPEITEGENFLVEKGENLFQVAQNLKDRGLIKNKYLFVLYVLLKGEQKNLKAGEYLLAPSMAVDEIAKKIISGETVKAVITIPEGWNLRDIGWYFENKGIFQAEEFFEIVGFPLIDYNKTADLPKPKDFSQDFDFLKDKPQNVGLEGYLFPDTYQIEKGSSVEEVVRIMLSNFDKKLTPELREEIQKQNKTIFEIITMASLLEKEVKTKEEKEIVAGILWKRLKYGIPLQVDATITYITGKKTIKISKDELQIDSPYNTYKYSGLPFGPICNPGLESISAAIYPKESNYWYYLSTPEGKTIFSRTLTEHNIAKAKHLK
jgi:UPF0755 protein